MQIPSAVPFVSTGTYPTREGNRVVPWIDGEPAFRRICECIDAAQRSVWVTITFMWPSFRMPDGRGSALDALQHAAERGVDVRLLCWRPDDETATLRTNAFWGSDAHRTLLAEHHGLLAVRWDRAEPGFCQHQKTWVIDGEIAFVGGINLNPHSLVSPGHAQGLTPQNHDLYVELAGAVVADVQHNFVQRWNEASERTRDDGRCGPRGDDTLPFPTHVPPPRGNVRAQIQRTMQRGRSVERTNLDQYLMAIAAARRTIYLEQQYVDVPEILDALDSALARGVRVVAVVPVEHRGAARLARWERFTCCGLASRTPDGTREPIHVHAKLMLVDDAWATVGSCNLHRYSLFGNAEMNVAFSDPATVRALRVTLFGEHLDEDTSGLTDGAALQRFQSVARENRGRRETGDTAWQGLAFELAPSR